MGSNEKITDKAFIYLLFTIFKAQAFLWHHKKASLLAPQQV